MMLTTASKVSAVREYARKKDYEMAATIADRINLRRVASLRDLFYIADVYKKLGSFEAAKEVYQELYARKKSAKVMTGMIDICLKMNDPKEAEAYLREFRKSEPHNPERLIYRYKVDRQLGKSSEYLLRSLTKLKDEEYTEEWGLELAKVYFRAGDRAACAAECHDLLLWFSGTEVADEAKELLRQCGEEAEKEAAKPAAAKAESVETEDNGNMIPAPENDQKAIDEAAFFEPEEESGEEGRIELCGEAPEHFALREDLRGKIDRIIFEDDDEDEPEEVIAAEEPIEEVAAEIAEEPIEEVAAEIVEEPIEEVAAEVVEEPIEEVAAEVVEEPIEEVAAEIVEEPIEEVAAEKNEAVMQEVLAEDDDEDEMVIYDYFDASSEQNIEETAEPVESNEELTAEPAESNEELTAEPAESNEELTAGPAESNEKLIAEPVELETEPEMQSSVAEEAWADDWMKSLAASFEEKMQEEQPKKLEDISFVDMSGLPETVVEETAEEAVKEEAAAEEIAELEETSETEESAEAEELTAEEPEEASAEPSEILEAEPEEILPAEEPAETLEAEPEEILPAEEPAEILEAEPEEILPAEEPAESADTMGDTKVFEDLSETALKAVISEDDNAIERALYNLLKEDEAAKKR